MVLKLKKSLCGQLDSPKLFCEDLSKGMTALDFEAPASDPCLSIHKREKIMVLNCCDHQIWLSPDNSLIEKCVKKLKENCDLTLEPEGNTFGFLGTEFNRPSGTANIELTQTGLIEKVICCTGMSNASERDTPVSTEPLGADKNGEAFNEEWSHPAAVGMLLCLASNTRPDIQFAVHQVARFSHCPRKSHAQTIKRIVQCLIATRDKGICFKPDLSEGLNCCVDADFAGLFGHEDDQDPVSVKSRTGFVLTLFGCPVIFQSKLQKEVTLSSTAAECVAFSMATRELLPMRRPLQEIGEKLGMDVLKTSLVRSTVFEDNQGCLSLVNVPKMSTRNECLSLKCHFFREQIGEAKGIVAKRISTEEQKAGIFTEGLPTGQLQKIRLLLMGW